MAPKAKVAVSLEWFVIVKTNEPEVISRPTGRPEVKQQTVPEDQEEPAET